MSSTPPSHPFEFSEADTCREYVTPAIQAAGWGDSPFEIAEQRSFTDGRIVLTGRTAKRREGTLSPLFATKRISIFLFVILLRRRKSVHWNRLSGSQKKAANMGSRCLLLASGHPT
jgi:type I restriction enzyme R subunit